MWIEKASRKKSELGNIKKLNINNYLVYIFLETLGLPENSLTPGHGPLIKNRLSSRFNNKAAISNKKSGSNFLCPG